MSDERDPREAERTEEPPEDLEISADDAEAVKGGEAVTNIAQTRHEALKAIAQNLRG